MAASLGVHAFRPWSDRSRQPPVRFIYAIAGAQRNMVKADNKVRCNAEFVDSSDLPHSAVVWFGDRRDYKPPCDSRCDRRAVCIGPSAAATGTGTDYAVVVVHATSLRRGAIVVGGLTGVGTLGAATLMCRAPDEFEPPPAGDARLFFVEIRVGTGGQMRVPTHGRVLEIWTRSSDERRQPKDDTFIKLDTASTILDDAVSPDPKPGREKESSGINAKNSASETADESHGGRSDRRCAGP